ncbi:hypothetical protein N9305_02280 [Pelagibacteraceae bacterium]|nr:hypothetical protein [Pelagibacteraceae bacterium]
MNFRFIILLLVFTSCTHSYNNAKIIKSFTSKGFAYIYDDLDFTNKIIKKKLNNDLPQIAHKDIRPGSLVRIINVKTNDSIIIKSSKRINYPDFYKVLITKPVADKLNLVSEFPLVEVTVIKKNKSFIAERTKIFKEEEQIHNKAPVENVAVANISKNIIDKSKKKKDNFYIIIAEFYSNDSALNLKKRINDELINFDIKKLQIKAKNSKKITLLSGPYTSINLMKNDYIQLKNLGFEELDISANEYK